MNGNWKRHRQEEGSRPAAGPPHTLPRKQEGKRLALPCTRIQG